jgi:DNA-binding CsgD family transcriptional regulator/tetratricopeptide (TPR) repeat protein
MAGRKCHPSTYAVGMHGPIAGSASWPFVCRADELAAIESASPHAPRAVIVGDAGVGKSRLLAELSDRSAAAGRRTVHAVATRSLCAIPFGAFAGVIRGSLVERDPRVDALQTALDDLVAGDDPSTVLVAVDDADLLDDASAGLVLLALHAGCAVAVTLRSGATCPDAITRLWADDLALRVDLEPLARDQVDQLLTHALGAPVEARTLHRLWEATQGNLLFLRELVRSARADGTLVEQDGVWAWTGSALRAPGVQDLVMERVVALDEGVREVADLVALGEPLSTTVVTGLTGAEALEEAEREGLVDVEHLGDRQEVRMAHPLYAEVLRDVLGRRRRQVLSGRIAAAIGSSGMRRADDPLRVAALQLEAGTVEDLELVLTATRLALQLADLGLAERLSRRALAASGDVRAAVLLAEPLYWQGRHDEIVELLGTGRLDGAERPEAAAGCMHVASALFWGGRPLEEAEAWLARGEAAGAPYDAELRGQHAAMLMFAGRPAGAITVGRGVLDDPSATPLARMHAYEGLLPALAMCGRLAEVDRELPSAFALVDADADLAQEAGGMAVGAFLSALFQGTLDDLTPLLGDMHTDAVRRVDDPFRGVWVFLLGRAALAQGRLTAALGHLREATAVLRGRDPGAVLPWALAALAQAQGTTGDVDGARRSVAEAEACRPPTLHAFDVDVELGRAWAAAAGGERSEPQAIAAAVGRRLLADGAPAVAALALHEALRLEADPAGIRGALMEASARAEGTVVATMALHAGAMVDGDPDRLVAASVAFEEAGMVLHAAEAAACASRFAETLEQADQARVATSRARRLAAACGAVRTPLLGQIAATRDLSVLTRREREVSMMAARGMSKREIAERLHLSVRTIGNHLNHVYAKLRIHSRDELRQALAVPPDPD